MIFCTRGRLMSERLWQTALADHCIKKKCSYALLPLPEPPNSGKNGALHASTNCSKLAIVTHASSSLVYWRTAHQRDSPYPGSPKKSLFLVCLSIIMVVCLEEKKKRFYRIRIETSIVKKMSKKKARVKKMVKEFEGKRVRYRFVVTFTFAYR